VAYALVIIVSYLLGSIPFGLLLTKAAGLGDIRAIGSGNIGATNVLRTGNKKLAALTLFLDGAKGAAAVLLVEYLNPELVALAGLFALLGHLFPVWLKFKGGKGVATTVGVITALLWPLGILTMVVWMLVAWRFRYSSLAALVAIGMAPFGAYTIGARNLVWPLTVMALLVFWKHGANIKRLLDGTEPKIGQGKDAAPRAE